MKPICSLIVFAEYRFKVLVTKIALIPIKYTLNTNAIYAPNNMCINNIIHNLIIYVKFIAIFILKFYSKVLN